MSETQWRTHRLELDDQTLREWDAIVLASDPEGIVLDTSAYYPGGGGQPPDHGVLLWGGVQTRIVGARKGDDLYLIPAEGDPLPPPGVAVRGALDDARRTALMRTHSGLHVLCGVVFRDFGALVTGGNMEPLSARMDFDLPEVPPGFRDAVESACNSEVAAGLTAPQLESLALIAVGAAWLAVAAARGGWTAGRFAPGESQIEALHLATRRVASPDRGQFLAGSGRQWAA